MNRLCVAIVCLFFFSVCAADEWAIGYGIALNSYSIDDPDGPTGTKSGEVSLVNFFYFNDIGRDSRYFGQLFFRDFEVSSGTSNIGQAVEQLGLNFAYQWRVRFSKSFKPWFGGGVGISQNDFTSRDTVDSGGFLAATFPDRSETLASLLVNTMLDYDISDRFGLSVMLQHEQSLGDGITDTSLTGILKYSFK